MLNPGGEWDGDQRVIFVRVGTCPLQGQLHSSGRSDSLGSFCERQPHPPAFSKAVAARAPRWREVRLGEVITLSVPSLGLSPVGDFSRGQLPAGSSPGEFR